MKTKFRFFSVFFLALVLAVSAVGMKPATPARAAALVVNTLTDVDDGTCDGTHCSLREAINEAENAVSNDTITFSVSGTIHLASTLPIVTNAGTLTIDGGGNITISGDTDSDNDGDVHILTIHPFANVTLQNLTVTYGLDASSGGAAIQNSGTLSLSNVTISNSATTSASQGGGAIYNSGGDSNLTIANSVLTGNSASFPGGAIYNISGSVTITDSVLSGNSSTTGSGGAIYNSGPLTITGSTFSANLAPSAGGGAIAEVTTSGTPSITGSTFFDNQANFGGAIYVSQATMTVTGSTFESNDATNDAGAIYLASSGVLTVTNSTISANTTASRGGGIFSFNPVTLTNVTISDNTSTGGAGGVHMFDTLTVNNTIVANNVTGGDCILDSGGSVSGTSSNNLVEDALNACGLTNGVDGNIVGSDPLLGPLQNNGGSTETHALLSGSPAINAGTNTGCPATDQIGLTRPQGGTCDIGAVEKEIISLTLTSTGSEDGWVLESTETSTAGGTLNSTATTFRLGDDVADKQYRAILSFDTGQLPNNAIITKVKIKIKYQSVVGTDPFTTHGTLYLDIRTGSFGNAGLELADFQSTASLGSAASIPNTPVSNWYTKVLSSTALTYISKTTRTQFRLRFQYGDNDDLGNDYLAFYSGDHANSAVWPQLIIEYYLP
jgi:CSLREA domain-containing protein